MDNGPIDNTQLDEGAATQEDALRLKPRNVTVLLQIASALSKADWPKIGATRSSGTGAMRLRTAA